MAHTIPQSGGSDVDDMLATALEDANLPALMMALVHLGDEAILDGPIRPEAGGLLDQTGGIGAGDAAALRARAARVISDHFASGAAPRLPTRERLIEMMSFAAGQKIPTEYVPLMLRFLDLDPQQQLAPPWQEDPGPARRGRVRVIVIGGGESGICAAIRLQRAGLPYLLFEKDRALGGTWHENVYPGCRVDSPNHFYCYGFEPKNDWPEYYSTQPVLHRYLEDCATRYGIRDNVRLETEVLAARFDEARALWVVTTRAGDGTVACHEAEVVISAVGQLNRPKLPDIPGLEAFSGKVMHTGAWDRAFALDGKRVGAIGSGASAMQLVPAITDMCGHLTVFQREATWVIGNPLYARTVSEGKTWLMEHVPFYAQWYRLLLCWMVADKVTPAVFADPDWPDQSRSISAMSERFREQLMDYLVSQVGDNPDLLARMTPAFPPFGKRILVDAGWFRTIRRPDVTLVMDRISHVEPEGIVTTDGTLHRLDVIACATGFHANRFLWPMEIQGTGGRRLDELWGDDPRAYMGVAVPGFPNFFMLYGPNTNSGQGGSIFFNSECQMNLIMSLLATMVEDAVARVEVREDAFEAYNQRLHAKLATSVWAHPAVHSWYKNAHGRITTNTPWRTVDYFHMTRAARLEDFILTEAATAAA